MLPQSKRLGTELLSNVMKEGKRLRMKPFSVSYIQHKDKKGKVAIVVGKKVSASSVIRHQIKRKISAIVESFPLPQYYVVLGLEKVVLEMKKEEIEFAYRDILSKLQ